MPARIPSYRPKGQPKRRRYDAVGDLTPEAHERRKFLKSTRWRKLRLAHLRAHPLCQDCEDEGIVTPAKEVHHLEKRTLAPDLELDADNLRSLCRPHHGVRTARGE